MKTPTMRFYFHEQKPSIDFHIDLDSNDLIDQLAFVKLVELKFHGTIIQLLRFWRTEKKLSCSVILKFDNFTAFINARTHCHEKITDIGHVSDAYRGALDRADPGRQLAHELKHQINAASISN